MGKRVSFLPSKDALQKRLWHFEDEGFQERLPACYEFLATAILDGEERKGGSIAIFSSNGVLKVCFQDRHTQLGMYAVLDVSKEFWSQLEGFLTSPPEPWAPMKAAGPKPVF